VFCSGNPIFPVAASPSYEDAALQIDAIMAENSKSAKWIRELLLFFQDGMKYNLHALEVAWNSGRLRLLKLIHHIKEVKKESQDNNLAR